MKDAEIGGEEPLMATVRLSQVRVVTRSEAVLVNLLDDSLSADLARDGALTAAMAERFLALSRLSRSREGVNAQTRDSAL